MATVISENRCLELFVRSLSPSEAPTANHIHRLRNLEHTGQIADATITVWGHEVGLAETPERTATGRFIRERIAAIRAWARENDVQVSPFFRNREVTDGITGECYTAVRLPVRCLVEYRDTDIAHVTPHRTEQRTVGVADRLQQLEVTDAMTTAPTSS